MSKSEWIKKIIIIVVGSIVAAYGITLALYAGFGAAGNIAAIENAFMKAGSEFGYEYSPKFNFPTSEHFAEMLRT